MLRVWTRLRFRACGMGSQRPPMAVTQFRFGFGSSSHTPGTAWFAGNGQCQTAKQACGAGHGYAIPDYIRE